LFANDGANFDRRRTCRRKQRHVSSFGLTDSEARRAATPPRCGPHHIGIVFGRDDRWGRSLTKRLIVDLAYQPAYRVLERGELLMVTADNMALLRFIEDSGVSSGSPIARGAARWVNPSCRHEWLIDVLKYPADTEVPWFRDKWR
jgi:hypothetical protein